MNNTVLITGATDGIGKQTAIELANKGYSIILHGRTTAKLLETKNEISSITGNNSIKYIDCDFSSLNNVVIMADKVKNQFPNLNVLINNAGIYNNELEYTIDKLEFTFAVNYLAPFLLTMKLLPQFLETKNSRIINVSSIAHTKAKFDLNNLNAEISYDHYNAYAISKLCNVFFTYFLANKYKNGNTNFYTLHPGVITTKLLKKGFNITGASLNDGAATSVFLAHSDAIKELSGKYFENCKEKESSTLSHDETIQNKLFEMSINLLKERNINI